MRDQRESLAKRTRRQRRAVLFACLLATPAVQADQPLQTSPLAMPPLPLSRTADAVRSNPFCEPVVAEADEPVRLASGKSGSQVRLVPIGAAVGLEPLGDGNARRVRPPAMTIEAPAEAPIQQNPMASQSAVADNDHLVARHEAQHNELLHGATPVGAKNAASVADIFRGTPTATHPTDSVLTVPPTRPDAGISTDAAIGSEPEKRESSIVLLPVVMPSDDRAQPTPASINVIAQPPAQAFDAASQHAPNSHHDPNAQHDQHAETLTAPLPAGSETLVPVPAYAEREPAVAQQAATESTVIEQAPIESTTHWSGPMTARLSDDMIEVAPASTMATPNAADESVTFSLSDFGDESGDSADGGSMQSAGPAGQGGIPIARVDASVDAGVDLVEPFVIGEVERSDQAPLQAIEFEADQDASIVQLRPRLSPVVDAPVTAQGTLHKKRYRPPVAVTNVPLEIGRWNEDETIQVQQVVMPAKSLADHQPPEQELSVPDDIKAVPLYLSLAQVRSLTIGGKISKVQVDDRNVCQAFSAGPSELKLIGTGNGVTRLVIWATPSSESGAARSRAFEIHVQEAVDATGEDAADQTEMLNRSIRSAFPNTNAIVRQVQNELVVIGQCDSEATAKKIIRMVRKTCLIPVRDELVVR